MGATYFEHEYKDGSSVRVLMMPFKLAKKEVPTLELHFNASGRMRNLSIRLFDTDGDKNLVPELYKGLGDYLKNAGLLLEDVTEDATEHITEEINKPPKKKLNNKVCVGCGNVYTPNSPAQKLCDGCKSKKIGDKYYARN